MRTSVQVAWSGGLLGAGVVALAIGRVVTDAQPPGGDVAPGAMIAMAVGAVASLVGFALLTASGARTAGKFFLRGVGHLVLTLSLVSFGFGAVFSQNAYGGGAACVSIIAGLLLAAVGGVLAWSGWRGPTRLPD